MKRLFVAFKIPSDPSLLSYFRSLKFLLIEEKIKWVEENNLHVTVKFLGETDEKKIPSICSILDNCSLEICGFEYVLRSIGVFGNKYSPRIIFTRIEPYAELVAIMQRLQIDFEQIGFPVDSQNHVPHLTLGRIKNIRDKDRFQRGLEQFAGFSSSTKKFDSLILYDSILRPQGPIYIPLEKFFFQNENPPMVSSRGI